MTSTTSTTNTEESEPANKKTKISDRMGDSLKNNKVSSSSSQTQTPITEDGKMPQKKFYRSRAHCNPLSHNDSFAYPSHPDLMDWTTEHYPNFKKVECYDDSNAKSIVPTVLDIGCGFGGLTVALATILPQSFILGLEIRAKVTEYVRLRILAFRQDNPGQYENCSVMRSNTMKFMPNLFKKASLEKIFFCFPDPHFKKKNHPRRIVSERLLSEYAYFLKPTIGRLYTITDVEDLHNWHVDKCGAHPMFRRLSEKELEDDPCVKAMYNETEEGKKVQRAGAKKYYAVYERISESDATDKIVNEDNFWGEKEFGVINT